MTINYTTGYAGTGKSTELIKLSKTLDIYTSVVIAPTHKALKRLRNDLPENLEIKTIHALLGWIPTINENAKHIDHINSTTKLNRELDAYNTIVIDEAGMMSEDMLMEITSRIEESNNFNTEHINLHLFLDPYQLLPVKGKQIEIDPISTINLTKQYRSEAKDIVDLFTKFVNFLEGTNKRDLKIIFSDNVHKMETIDAFQKGDRLLAYTNNIVGKYNKLIAEKFNIKSYEGQKVQLGNLTDLVKVEKFINPSLKDLIDYYKTERLYLQNSQINKKFLESNLQALIDCKDIKFISCNSYIIPVICGIGNANNIIKLAKEKALEDKKQFKWVYALNRAFIMDYEFASTVHKAQGSEFDRVWIIKDDIQKSILNNYYDNYARMMYVAISRAKKKVFIL
jgi:exodeoxyribonuclease-5